MFERLSDSQQIAVITSIELLISLLRSTSILPQLQPAPPQSTLPPLDAKEIIADIEAMLKR